MATGTPRALGRRVTAPRPVVAGRTYLISRRCTQRQFLLRPDARVEQIYLYCLGEAAARYGVTLHGWLAMSNHHHLLIRDERGNYPEFLAHLHKMIAKAMNAYRGRWENFWAAEQPSAVYVVESFDQLAKLVYVVANPVADDLVERVSDWPGASSLVQILSGGARRVRRPKGFFRADGPMPHEVELRAERLDGFAHLTDPEWRTMVAQQVEKAERVARAKRREEKRGVLGRKAVLRADANARPSTVEPRGGLRPCIACANGERRVVEIGLLRSFRALYRAAIALWRGGAHDALFPSGTFRMLWFGARTTPDMNAAPG